MTDQLASHLSRLQPTAWRALLEALPIEVVATDGSARVIYQNQRSRSTLGALSPDASLLDQAQFPSLGSCSWQVSPPGLESIDARAMIAGLAPGDAPLQVFLCHEGALRSFTVTCAEEDLLLWTAGERGTVEEAARSQITLSTAPGDSIENSKAGFFSWDLNSQEVVWDSRMYEITQARQPLTISEWLEKFTPREDQSKLRAVFKGFPERSPASPIACRFVRPSGEIRWVLISGTVERDAKGELAAFEGCMVDITDVQSETEAIHRAEKFDAFRRVAAGIAHNFNNLLMIIEPCLEALEEIVPESHQVFVRDASEAGARSHAIVRDLMIVGNQNAQRQEFDEERSFVPWAKFCAEVVDRCRNSSASDLCLEFSAQSKCSVYCGREALSNALLGLLQNAVLAASESTCVKPKVTVRARDVQEQDRIWVEIVILDNGPGMSADVRSKIFSPFFSTRQGAGRGLSLSLAQAIVHQHGGTLFCRNAANRQTEFVLRLPAQDAKSPYTTEVNMTENEAPSVRVLVVDDEPAICRVVNHILKRNGFSSVSVSDPGQIQATIERDGPFDIVLLDRSMGLTQGSALLPQLRAAAPGAKVLYFTGEFVEQDEVADVDGVVQKPVNGKQLTEVLRKVL